MFRSLFLSPALLQKTTKEKGICCTSILTTPQGLWIIYFKEARSFSFKASDPDLGLRLHFAMFALTPPSLALCRVPCARSRAHHLRRPSPSSSSQCFQVSHVLRMILTFSIMGYVLLACPQSLFKAPFTTAISVIFPEFQRTMTCSLWNPIRGRRWSLAARLLYLLS